MLRTLSFLIFVLILLPYVITRDSFYNGSPGNSEHPPFDLPDSNVNYQSDADCAPLCSDDEVVVPNPNLVASYTGGCANMLPSFIPNGLPSPLNFDSCCDFQQSCYQDCSMDKVNCDQQTFGCFLDSCVSYIRPADRLYCISYATCWAAYFTHNNSCDLFNTLQKQACICQPSGTTTNSTTPSNTTLPSPSTEPTNTTLLSPSPSTVPSNITSPSPSTVPLNITSPSNSPTVGSASPTPLPSSGFQIKRSFTVGKALRQVQTGTLTSYTPRSIPNWDAYQSRCPPNIQWLTVGTDQELDTILYRDLAGAASNLKMWWQ